MKPRQLSPIAMAVHGGAGTLSQGMLSPDQERDIHQARNEAVAAGRRLLESGATAVDVVEAGVRSLEDSPWFNAGKGAVYTYEGKHELDAAIMDGASLKAGAVAGIRHSPNPVQVARRVMDCSPHILLAGEGADLFAQAQGLPQVANNWFGTALRQQQWQRALLAENSGTLEPDAADFKFGTVGAVAIDQQGNLAAATSTGGITNKRYGRVGDTPLIGAGTFADNRSCAISATGSGEYFMRLAVAHEISARCRYLHESLLESATHTVWEELKALGGAGGVIGVDREGNLVLVFNTEGMYRGWFRQDEPVRTAIYAEDAVMIHPLSDKPSGA